jgi:hypothetical protein
VSATSGNVRVIQRLRSPLAGWLFVAVSCAAPGVGAMQGGDTPGSDEDGLTVTPAEAVAGTFQRLRFVIPMRTAAAAGGGVRFELPVAYGETEPLFWSRPQTLVADGPGYVRAASASGVPLQLAVAGIAGGIVQITFPQALEAGDTVVIAYEGLVQSLARSFVLRAEVRPSPDSAWRAVGSPTFTVHPREPATLLVVSPSDVALGEAFDVAVVLLDRYGNRSAGYRGTVRFHAGSATGLPDAYTFTAIDSGVALFAGVRHTHTGFHRVRADADALEGRTNYTYVWPGEPRERRYFGDTHFHTGTGTRNRGFIGLPAQGDINTLDLRNFTGINLGGDHRGNFTTAEQAYQYVRDVIRLDFAASTEHDAVLLDSLAWMESQRISSSFNDPGRFTTFYGYEWTPGSNHHIVLYDREGNDVFDHRSDATLPALWEALDRQGRPALTIPHVTWPVSDHVIWEHVHNGYRRVGEIYSLWNGRFLVQPDDDPQRFETGPGRWSYQHAWSHGHRIGVIGATDNHLGQPGANNYTIYTQHTGGLAVVLAARNERTELWGGMHARRTYATTGTRIYLDFTVDGQPVGSEITATAPPHLSVRVAGTNRLEAVEVLKYDARSGYRVIHAVRPDSDTAVFSVRDDHFDLDSFYYVRVKQVPEYSGRPYTISTSEMAWSSPVWVKRER